VKLNIIYNTKQNGIELHFDDKPEQNIINKVKAMGFKYSPGKRIWWTKETQSRKTFAEQLKNSLENGENIPTYEVSPSFEATKENIEKKNFSYVSIYILNDRGETEPQRYIIFEPSKPKAQGIASVFAKNTFGDNFKDIHVYPKTYIREARLLYEKGDIIDKVKLEDSVSQPTEITDLPNTGSLRESAKESEATKDLPDNYWELVEKHLPNYHSRDDVLENDILTRYVNKEKISSEDEKWIKKQFGNDNLTENAEQALEESNRVLYQEALENKKNQIEQEKVKATDESRDKKITNIILPKGVREPFATGRIYLRELLENISDYPDLLKINEDKLSEATAGQMFELIQMAHPNDYGIDVSRSAMLKEWEETGESIFVKLGFPIADNYPYININTGYSSIYPLKKELKGFGEGIYNKWWGVADNYRPIADMDKALEIIDDEIKTLEDKQKEFLNPKTGKAKDKHKEEDRSIDYKIINLQESKQVIKNYIKSKPKKKEPMKSQTIVKQPYSSIYKKLHKVIPDIIKYIDEGKTFGKSQLKSAGMMDLHFDFLEKDSDGNYIIALSHYFKQGGDMVPDPDMQIKIIPKMKVAEAMHYQDQFGYKAVYITKDGKNFVDTNAKRNQNQFLSQWLTNLINQGHQIDLSKKIENTEDTSDSISDIEVEKVTKEEQFRKAIKSSIARLTDMSIDLEGEPETIIAGTRFNLEDALDESDINKAFKLIKKEVEEMKDWTIDFKDKNIEEKWKQEEKILLKAINEFEEKETLSNEKLDSKELYDAYWKQTDEEYPVNKVTIDGIDYNQSRLRDILLDLLAKFKLESQLIITEDLANQFEPRRPFEKLVDEYANTKESDEKKRKYLIRNFTDNILLDNSPKAMAYLKTVFINDTKDNTDMSKQTSPKEQALKKNAFNLNQEIEQFIDKKDTEESLYDDEDKNYIAQYSGSGGKIKQGASGVGILYEYYTPDAIVQQMWGLAYEYGYNGGDVLEPACGIGNFIKYVPRDSKVIGFETNHYAARIAEILYPKAIINRNAFETIFFSGNIHLKDNFGYIKYDLVIGNPPYGDFSGKYAGMGEKNWTKAVEYDHYFITRGLDLLNIDGLLIFIIPSSFLQNSKKYNAVKEKISKKADLVKAFRLPTGIFKSTVIGTDIVVFKRK